MKRLLNTCSVCSVTGRYFFSLWNLHRIFSYRTCDLILQKGKGEPSHRICNKTTWLITLTERLSASFTTVHLCPKLKPLQEEFSHVVSQSHLMMTGRTKAPGNVNRIMAAEDLSTKLCDWSGPDIRQKKQTTKEYYGRQNRCLKKQIYRHTLFWVATPLIMAPAVVVHCRQATHRERLSASFITVCICAQNWNHCKKSPSIEA